MEIIPSDHKKIFSFEDAQSLLPVVYRITEVAQKEVKNLIHRMEALNDQNSSRSSEIEDKINSAIDRWQQKIQKLGASPKGLWLADFDNGKGYYCWKFPETEILYWHGYNDGFSGRKAIKNRVTKTNRN